MKNNMSGERVIKKEGKKTQSNHGLNVKLNLTTFKCFAIMIL